MAAAASEAKKLGVGKRVPAAVLSNKKLAGNSNCCLPPVRRKELEFSTKSAVGPLPANVRAIAAVAAIASRGDGPKVPTCRGNIGQKGLGGNNELANPAAEPFGQMGCCVANGGFGAVGTGLGDDSGPLLAPLQSARPEGNSNEKEAFADDEELEEKEDEREEAFPFVEPI